MGPDRGISYDDAEAGVKDLKIAGGGWRMPTRNELRGLYVEGLGERNMDPAFKTTGWWVWAEPKDAETAWVFDFNAGQEYSYVRATFNDGHRVFAVRSGKK